MKDLVETVGFIRDNMATKDDIRELTERIDTLDTRTNRIEDKVDGLSNRLDHELDNRKTLEVRVTKIEEKVGA